MRVLVTAASRHDATREIAEVIADGLSRWLKTARGFVSEDAAALSAMPVWLFSSRPLGPPDHLMPPEESADSEQMTELVDAHGHREFAGRLEQASLGFGERAAATAVHAPDGDCRDWDAIDAFPGDIAAELSAQKAAR